MRRALRHRFATALFVVLSLLTSQQAMARYVCPLAENAAAMAAMVAAGLPCTGVDADQPVLCQRHAADATPSFEDVKVLTATLAATVQVLILPPLPAPPAGTARSPSGDEAVRPPPDPVFLSTLRLRV